MMMIDDVLKNAEYEKRFEKMEVGIRNREVIADLQRKRIEELEKRMAKIDGEERTTYRQRLEAEKVKNEKL